MISTFNIQLYSQVTFYFALILTLVKKEIPKALEMDCCAVQLSSCVWLLAAPWTTACQASLSLTISQSLPNFMLTASVMPFSHFIHWDSLLLLPSIFPSIVDFSTKLPVHIRWLNYWSFSFSISPSSDYSVLISCKTDCFDILAAQGTLRSLLQQHSLKASVLWCSAFFTAQLSQMYVTTGKTITLTLWTFVSRVTSLLFNIASRFVFACLTRSGHLQISWLQSPSAVLLESKKRKSATASTFPLSICHVRMGPDAMILLLSFF